MHAPAPLPPPEALLERSRRLGGIWMALMRGIGGWIGRQPATPAQTLVLTRAGRLVARVQAILALLAAGRLPRAYRPRPGRAKPTPPVDPQKPRTPRLPRKIGWLVGRTTEINGAATNLRHWLADPATRAALAEVPPLRKPLATLCRLLLIAPFPAPPDQDFPRPKPRERKPAPPKPRRETLRELRAWCAATYRNIEIDDGLVKRGKRPWWLPPQRYRRC